MSRKGTMAVAATPVIVARNRDELIAAGVVLFRRFHLVIPEDSPPAIPEKAFLGCTGIVSATIPNGVVEIGPHAFYGCSGLTSVIIPGGVTAIGVGAFQRCFELTSVALPKGVVSVGAGAFCQCRWLVAVTLPAGVDLGSRTRCDTAFSHCSNLSCVVAPEDGIDAVQEGFSDCPMLTEIEVDTPKARLQALRLRYWTLATHWRCSPRRRERVETILLVAARLRQGGSDSDIPSMPTEMWLAVLELVPR